MPTSANVRLTGSTSGYVELAAPAVAGSTSLTLPATSGTVALESGAWTSYTVTVGAGSGTATTLTAAGRYIQIGKTVHARMAINITNKGTAGSYIQVSLPVPATTAGGIDPTGVAANFALGTAGITLLANANNIAIWKYDGTTMWANNPITVSITYEAA